MTLTWNYPNQLGYPAKATGGEFAGKVFSEAGYGLTARGIEFLEEMENLGMIIDVAHLNDAGIRDDRAELLCIFPARLERRRDGCEQSGGYCGTCKIYP